MTIDKVKPKVSKESTRVTQVHGPMQGCDVLAIVESLKNQKAEEERRKLKRVQQQEEEKQRCLLCKTECTCGKKGCAALGLRERPKCHSILRSICSKAGCKENGKKHS